MPRKLITGCQAESKMKPRKIVAVLILLIFTLNQVPEAWAQPVLAAPSVTFQKLELPAGLGRVETSGFYKQRPLVIHIQAAHGNGEAASQIEKILRLLQQKYHFKKLLVEGAEGNLDPSMSRFMGNKNQDRQIADYRAEHGRFSGVGLFLLDAPNVQATGIESAEAYRHNRDIVNEFYNQRQAAVAEFKTLQQVFKNVFSKFPAPLKQFLKQEEAASSLHASMETYVEMLRMAAAKHLGVNLVANQSLASRPNLVRLVRILKLSKKIDMQAAQKEWQIFAKKNGRKVRSDVWRQFSAVIDTAVKGQSTATIQMERYHLRYLLEFVLHDSGLSTSEALILKNQYPHWIDFLKTLVYQNELDAEALQNEIEAVSTLIQKHFASTPELVQALEHYETFRFYQRLFVLELMPKNYAHAEKIKSPLKLDASLGISQEVRVKLEKPFQSALAFYRAARERETYFYENVDRALSSADTREPVVIVSGGFHSQSLIDHFKQNQYSYLVIQPHLQKIDSRNAYFQSLLQKGSPDFNQATLENAADLPLTEPSFARLGFDSQFHARQVRLDVQAAARHGRFSATAFSHSPFANSYHVTIDSPRGGYRAGPAQTGTSYALQTSNARRAEARVAQAELKGKEAKEPSDQLLHDLIKVGRVGEYVVAPDGAVKLQRFDVSSINYRHGETEPKDYLVSEEIDKRDVNDQKSGHFLDAVQQTALKQWVDSHKDAEDLTITKTPRIRVIFGDVSIHFKKNFKNSHIFKADKDDNVLYIGEELLKFLLTDAGKALRERLDQYLFGVNEHAAEEMENLLGEFEPTLKLLYINLSEALIQKTSEKLGVKINGQSKIALHVMPEDKIQGSQTWKNNTASLQSMQTRGGRKVNAALLPIGADADSMHDAQRILAYIRFNPRLVGMIPAAGFKDKVASYLDHVSDLAKVLGVDPVFKRDGSEELSGELDLGESQAKWLEWKTKKPVKRRSFLILGGGVTGMAAAYQLIKAGAASVTISDIDTANLNRAKKISDQLLNADEQARFHIINTKKNGVKEVEAMNAAIDSADVIMNSTGLGKEPYLDRAPPIEYTRVHNGQLWVDLNYRPKITMFLRKILKYGQDTTAEIDNAIDLTGFINASHLKYFLMGTSYVSDGMEGVEPDELFERTHQTWVAGEKDSMLQASDIKLEPNRAAAIASWQSDGVPRHFRTMVERLGLEIVRYEYKARDGSTQFAYRVEHGSNYKKPKLAVNSLRVVRAATTSTSKAEKDVIRGGEPHDEKTAVLIPDGIAEARLGANLIAERILENPGVPRVFIVAQSASAQATMKQQLEHANQILAASGRANAVVQIDLKKEVVELTDEQLKTVNLRDRYAGAWAGLTLEEQVYTLGGAAVFAVAEAVLKGSDAFGKAAMPRAHAHADEIPENTIMVIERAIQAIEDVNQNHAGKDVVLYMNGFMAGVLMFLLNPSIYDKAGFDARALKHLERGIPFELFNSEPASPRGELRKIESVTVDYPYYKGDAVKLMDTEQDIQIIVIPKLFGHIAEIHKKGRHFLNLKRGSWLMFPWAGAQVTRDNVIIRPGRKRNVPLTNAPVKAASEDVYNHGFGRQLLEMFESAKDTEHSLYYEMQLDTSTPGLHPDGKEVPPHFKKFTITRSIRITADGQVKIGTYLKNNSRTAKHAAWGEHVTGETEDRKKTLVQVDASEAYDDLVSVNTSPVDAETDFRTPRAIPSGFNRSLTGLKPIDGKNVIDVTLPNGDGIKTTADPEIYKAAMLWAPANEPTVIGAYFFTSGPSPISNSDDPRAHAVLIPAGKTVGGEITLDLKVSSHSEMRTIQSKTSHRSEQRPVLPRVDPSQTKAWAVLQHEFPRMRKLHLRDLLKDKDRSRKLRRSFKTKHMEMDVDYSRERIVPELLDVLLELANETKLPESIRLMFEGAPINETEGRAVGHVALRMPADGEFMVDGKNVVPEVHTVLEKMRVITEKVNSGQWKGYSGKKITDVVNIGIGGSDLGPKMASDALGHYSNGNVKMHFVSSVDSSDMKSVLKDLNPETTLFIVVSKTFETDETLTNARLARKWLLDYVRKYNHKKVPLVKKAIERHFIAVSTNRKEVEKFGIDADNNMLEFWDWVGGRYSMWGAVGLSIMIRIGFKNFKQMLAGAHAMDEHFRRQPLKNNIPVISALLDIWYLNFFKAETHTFVPYAAPLEFLPAYLMQLIMESNGKRTDRSGRRVDYVTVPVVGGMTGPNEAHAGVGQALGQARQKLPVTYLGFAKSLDGSHVAHKKLMDAFQANPHARAIGLTLQELQAEGRLHASKHQVIPGNQPSKSIVIDQLTPYSFGAMIAMFEHQTAVTGFILNIFSFDQWGVQFSKRLVAELNHAGKWFSKDFGNVTAALRAMRRPAKKSVKRVAPSRAEARSSQTLPRSEFRMVGDEQRAFPPRHKDPELRAEHDAVSKDHEKNIMKTHRAVLKMIASGQAVVLGQESPEAVADIKRLVQKFQNDGDLHTILIGEDLDTVVEAVAGKVTQRSNWNEDRAPGVAKIHMVETFDQGQLSHLLSQIPENERGHVRVVRVGSLNPAMQLFLEKLNDANVTFRTDEVTDQLIHRGTLPLLTAGLLKGPTAVGDMHYGAKHTWEARKARESKKWVWKDSAYRLASMIARFGKKGISVTSLWMYSKNLRLLSPAIAQWMNEAIGTADMNTVVSGEWMDHWHSTMQAVRQAKGMDSERERLGFLAVVMLFPKQKRDAIISNLAGHQYRGFGIRLLTKIVFVAMGTLLQLAERFQGAVEFEVETTEDLGQAIHHFQIAALAAGIMAGHDESKSKLPALEERIVSEANSLESKTPSAVKEGEIHVQQNILVLGKSTGAKLTGVLGEKIEAEDSTALQALDTLGRVVSKLESKVIKPYRNKGAKGHLDAKTVKEEAIVAEQAAKLLTDGAARKKRGLKPIKKIYAIAIGGSTFGPILTNVLGMANQKGAPEVIEVTSIDAEEMSRILEDIENSDDPESIGVVVISKSGATGESDIGFSTIYEALALKIEKFKKLRGDSKTEEAKKIVDGQILAITDAQPNKLRNFVVERGIASINHPALIGGRWSMFSSVGLIHYFIKGGNSEKLLQAVEETQKWDDELEKALRGIGAWEMQSQDRGEAAPRTFNIKDALNRKKKVPMEVRREAIRFMALQLSPIRGIWEGVLANLNNEVLGRDTELTVGLSHEFEILISHKNPGMAQIGAESIGKPGARYYRMAIYGWNAIKKIWNRLIFNKRSSPTLFSVDHSEGDSGLRRQELARKQAMIAELEANGVPYVSITTGEMSEKTLLELMFFEYRRLAAMAALYSPMDISDEGQVGVDHYKKIVNAYLLAVRQQNGELAARLQNALTPVPQVNVKDMETIGDAKMNLQGMVNLFGAPEKIADEDEAAQFLMAVIQGTKAQPGLVSGPMIKALRQAETEEMSDLIKRELVKRLRKAGHIGDIYIDGRRLQDGDEAAAWVIVAKSLDSPENLASHGANGFSFQLYKRNSTDPSTKAFSEMDLLADVHIPLGSDERAIVALGKSTQSHALKGSPGKINLIEIDKPADSNTETFASVSKIVATAGASNTWPENFQHYVHEVRSGIVTMDRLPGATAADISLLFAKNGGVLTSRMTLSEAVGLDKAVTNAGGVAMMMTSEGMKSLSVIREKELKASTDPGGIFNTRQYFVVLGSPQSVREIQVFMDYLAARDTTGNFLINDVLEAIEAIPASEEASVRAKALTWLLRLEESLSLLPVNSISEDFQVKEVVQLLLTRIALLKEKLEFDEVVESLREEYFSLDLSQRLRRKYDFALLGYFEAIDGRLKAGEEMRAAYKLRKTFSETPLHKVLQQLTVDEHQGDWKRGVERVIGRLETYYERNATTLPAPSLPRIPKSTFKTGQSLSNYLKKRAGLPPEVVKEFRLKSNKLPTSAVKAQEQLINIYLNDQEVTKEALAGDPELRNLYSQRPDVFFKSKGKLYVKSLDEIRRTVSDSKYHPIVNSSGDISSLLDSIYNPVLVHFMKPYVSFIISEEDDLVLNGGLKVGGGEPRLLLKLDPIDGSSNVESGTVFGLIQGLSLIHPNEDVRTRALNKDSRKQAMYRKLNQIYWASHEVKEEELKEQPGLQWLRRKHPQLFFARGDHTYLRRLEQIKNMVRPEELDDVFKAIWNHKLKKLDSEHDMDQAIDYGSLQEILGIKFKKRNGERVLEVFDFLSEKTRPLQDLTTRDGRRSFNPIKQMLGSFELAFGFPRTVLRLVNRWDRTGGKGKVLQFELFEDGSGMREFRFGNEIPPLTRFEENLEFRGDGFLPIIPDGAHLAIAMGGALTEFAKETGHAELIHVLQTKFGGFISMYTGGLGGDVGAEIWADITSHLGNAEAKIVGVLHSYFATKGRPQGRYRYWFEILHYAMMYHILGAENFDGFDNFLTREPVEPKMEDQPSAAESPWVAASPWIAKFMVAFYSAYQEEQVGKKSSKKRKEWALGFSDQYEEMTANLVFGLVTLSKLRREAKTPKQIRDAVFALPGNVYTYSYVTQDGQTVDFLSAARRKNVGAITSVYDFLFPKKRAEFRATPDTSARLRSEERPALNTSEAGLFAYLYGFDPKAAAGLHEKQSTVSGRFWHELEADTPLESHQWTDIEREASVRDYWKKMGVRRFRTFEGVRFNPLLDKDQSANSGLPVHFSQGQGFYLDPQHTETYERAVSNWAKQFVKLYRDMSGTNPQLVFWAWKYLSAGPQNKYVTRADVDTSSAPKKFNGRVKDKDILEWFHPSAYRNSADPDNKDQTVQFEFARQILRDIRSQLGPLPLPMAILELNSAWMRAEQNDKGALTSAAHFSVAVAKKGKLIFAAAPALMAHLKRDGWGTYQHDHESGPVTRYGLTQTAPREGVDPEALVFSKKDIFKRSPFVFRGTMWDAPAHQKNGFWILNFPNENRLEALKFNPIDEKNQRKLLEEYIRVFRALTAEHGIHREKKFSVYGTARDQFKKFYGKKPAAELSTGAFLTFLDSLPEMGAAQATTGGQGVSALAQGVRVEQRSSMAVNAGGRLGAALGQQSPNAFAGGRDRAEHRPQTGSLAAGTSAPRSASADLLPAALARRSHVLTVSGKQPLGLQDLVSAALLTDAFAVPDRGLFLALLREQTPVDQALGFLLSPESSAQSQDYAALIGDIQSWTAQNENENAAGAILQMLLNSVMPKNQAATARVTTANSATSVETGYILGPEIFQKLGPAFVKLQKMLGGHARFVVWVPDNYGQAEMRVIRETVQQLNLTLPPEQRLLVYSNPASAQRVLIRNGFGRAAALGLEADRHLFESLLNQVLDLIIWSDTERAKFIARFPGLQQLLERFQVALQTRIESYA